MKIGICFEGRNVNNIDYSNPELGNPGIGGTTFLQILLGYYLKDRIDVCMYVLENQIFPSGLNQKIVKDDIDCINQAKEDGIDIFIFIAGRKDKLFYDVLRKSNLISVAWAHNYLDCNTIKEIEKSKNIKRVVFVGQQLYDSYIDDNIIKKSTVIFNISTMLDYSCLQDISQRKAVTYVGALIKGKGFHKLARQWKYIVKQVPNAHLYVIGSGKLYSHKSKMGKFDLAEQKYEKTFIKYLMDGNGKILDSVTFCGTLGTEKIDILSKTAVGVPNPTGKTETFCLSAVEMESMGIPIVSYKGFGLLDTVLDKKTGLLSRSSLKMRKSIVRLLNDSELNSKLGNEAKKMVREKFVPERIIPEWIKLFEDIINDSKQENRFSKKFLWDDYKFIKYINYKLKDKFSLNFVPSISYSISKCKYNLKLLKKLLK